MSKFKLSVLLVILAVFSTAAIAGDKVVKRVPAGAVAFHFVADVDYASGALVGYLAFIEGVDSSLFKGAASESTAYFTICLTEPTAPPIFLVMEQDINVALLEPVGARFTVFFNPDPPLRSWELPETFCEGGVPIAEFEESALLSTGVAGNGFNVFSSGLINSKPIKFNGQKIDFRKLVPNGVTATNFTSARMTGARFGGTAIAIGGKPRKYQHDDGSDD